MNYLTKLVLSKVSENDLYAFILEDCKIYHSLNTDIGYRKVGSFCFMFKRRQSDSSLISLSVFLASDSTIHGILDPSSFTPFQREDETQVILRSKHYTSQNISGTLTDENFLLNYTNPDDSVNVRCSAIAEDVKITYDKKRSLLSTQGRSIYINMSTLRHQDSYIYHFGGMRTAKGATDTRKASSVLNLYSICGKIISVRNEGFKIGDVSFGEWQIFKIRTPFLGNIDILSPEQNIKYDISLEPYGEFKIFETTIDTIPLYAESYNDTHVNFMKILTAILTSKSDYNLLKNSLKNDCALYFDGIRIVKGKDSVPFVLNELKNYLTDKRVSNTIFNGVLKEIDGEKNDVFEYLSPNKFNRGFYLLVKKLSDKCAQNNIKFDNTPDHKFDPDYYKKFIGTETILFASTKRKVINSIIFAEKSSNGLINEIHISSLPIFDINLNEAKNMPFFNSNGIIKFDFTQNVETSHPITPEFLINFMPSVYQEDMKKQLINLRNNSFYNLDTLIYSVLAYLKNYTIFKQNGANMVELSIQMAIDIDESVKITKAITTPYYDILSYMAYFVPEIMYEVGKRFALSGASLEEIPTVDAIVETIKNRILKSEEVLPPFNGEGMLYWSLYMMGKFVPRNEELLIKNMTNIALTFLICGMCEIQ